MNDPRDHAPHDADPGPSDEDTAEIPAVERPKAKIADLVWIGAGAIGGLIAMVVFAGGLGAGDDGGDAPLPATTVRTRTLTPAPATPATPTGPAAKPRPATPPATTTTTAAPRTTTTTAAPRPAPPARTDGQDTTTDASPAPATGQETITAPTDTTAAGEPYVMTVGAKPDKTVYIEVRAASAGGERLFAGEVGADDARAFRADGPLWIGFGWAGNAVVSIDGREVAAEGGTDAFIVTATGLERVPKGGG